jgi:hypothetical protein
LSEQLPPSAVKPGWTLPAGAVKPGWTTTEFWQTMLVHVFAVVVALGTLFHTHFNLNGLQAAVPSVAMFASAVAQAVYSHSRAMVKSSAQAARLRAASSGSFEPGPIIVQLAGIQRTPGPSGNGALAESELVIRESLDPDQ